MIARPYLIGLIVLCALILVTLFLANGVSPEQETVVDVIEGAKQTR